MSNKKEQKDEPANKAEIRHHESAAYPRTDASAHQDESPTFQSKDSSEDESYVTQSDRGTTSSTEPVSFGKDVEGPNIGTEPTKEKYIHSHETSGTSYETGTKQEISFEKSNTSGAKPHESPTTGYATGAKQDISHEETYTPSAKQSQEISSTVDAACTRQDRTKTRSVKPQESKVPTRCNNDPVYIDTAAKGRNSKSYREVPVVTKEFVLYCDERVHDVTIKLAGKEIQMQKASHNIYKRKITLNYDYLEGIKYTYEVKSSNWFLIDTTCKLKFPLDSRHIYRDCLKVTSDAIATHLDHIILSSDERNEAKMQIQTLPIPALSEKDLQDLVQSQISKLSSISGLEKYIVSIAIFFSLCFFKKVEFSKETARGLLGDLQGLTILDLPEICHAEVQNVCTSLCNLCFDQNTREIADLFFSFPFLGEEILYKKLLAMKYIVFDFTIEQNTNLIVDLLKKICRSTSFGNEMSEKVIEIIINILPFEKTMAFYHSVMEMNQEFESNEQLKSLLTGQTLKRTEKILSQTLGEHKFGKFLHVWENVRSAEDWCDPFRHIFESCLMDLIKSSKSQKPEIVVQIAEEAILFSTPQLKVELLNAIVNSPCDEMSELFMEFSKLHGYDDLYQTLDPLTYKNWFYKSNDTRERKNKVELSLVCRRLGWILSIKGVSEAKLITHTVKEILSEELQKRTQEQLLSSAKEFEEITENNVLLNTFVVQVSSEMNKMKTDVEKLLCPFLVDGVLLMKTKFIADIICLVIEKYGNTGDDTTHTDQFFNALDQWRLWALFFKSEGPGRDEIEKHPFYISVSKCVRMTGENLSKFGVDFRFVKRVCARRDEVICLLSCFLQDDDMTRRIIDLNERKINEVEKRIGAITSVMKSLKKMSINLPDTFEQFSRVIEAGITDFYEGRIVVRDSHLIWKSTEQLPVNCIELETAIKSVVFWNLLRDEMTEDPVSNNDDKENLFVNVQDKQSSDSEKKTTTESSDKDLEIRSDQMEVWKSANIYIANIRSIGIRIYKEHMQAFRECNDISISQILHMFDYKKAKRTKLDLDMEKHVSECVLKISFNDSIWEDLKRIYSIGDMKSKVEGMKSFLQVVQVDLDSDTEFASALKSFDQLLSNDVSEYCFSKVRALEMVYAISSTLSESTFDIMISAGECSSLIDFLNETVDEDIRNLIDAVEDISEHQVRESTVSGLIEIQQFFLPILKQNKGDNCQCILNLLENQVKRISESSSIPAKLHDCMENLHNLKSLYNNVANRGEQTKQIVKNIIEHGYFIFQLDENSESLLLESRYKMNDNVVTKKRAELIDLRSRSLLLMNTENKTSSSNPLSKKEVEIFVGFVDQCIELSEIYLLLYTSGHFRYTTIDQELDSSSLLETKVKLEKEFNDWKTKLQDVRNKHYLMNYIYGFGLHAMFQYLNMYEHLSVENQVKLGNTVQTLLVFIHPKMRASELKCIYSQEKAKCKIWKNANWLYCFGVALHRTNTRLPASVDFLIVEENSRVESLKMTDVVEEGKLFLAQLKESSLYTMQTVMALYANTVNRMPKAHQVLFCNRETTMDEADLLIERCIGAKKFFGKTHLYCVANIELLPSGLYSDFLDSLRSVQENHTQFRLALVCRGTNSQKIIDELNQYKTTVAHASDSLMKSIFKTQHKNVITLTSDLAGLGKSTKVIRYAHIKKKAVSILHISGSSRRANLIERLNSLKVQPYHALHIDIGTVDDSKELDTFLFQLLILGYASSGRISVALKTDHVFLEIANTINEALRNSLQTVMLFSREHICWKKFEDFVVSKEIQSSVQIVCKYLIFLERGYLDKKDVILEESKPLSTTTCRRLLKKYIGMANALSFPVVRTSLDVLADQFKKMTCSPFFRVFRLREMTGNAEQNVKSSLIAAMIKNSNEFASRSVNSCRTSQTSTTDERVDIADSNDLAAKVAQRIQGMIRWEESNHLMFVFHCQNIQTLSPLYRQLSGVPKNIKDLFHSQMNNELQEFRELNQTKLQDLLQRIARNSPIPLPSNRLKQLASDYALAPDNLLKMVLIMLRVKANVPVVIMGETGCGKTSLVRYLASICEVPFDVLNIHAGVTEKSIILAVQNNCIEASKTLSSERWLFLDEINTSESIGVMSEIICHHKCLGKSLPPNLVVMGACNPYKLKSKKHISTAGLSIKSQTDELSRLVYRVLPLPEMIVDYVWDFGSLNETDEKLYINRMTDGLFQDENVHCLMVEMLSASQTFVRKKEGSACVVSLRDVNRCKLLTKWFKLVLKKTPCKPYTFNCDTNIRAIVLALAHCYHSRFPSNDIRNDYRRMLRAKLTEHNITGFEAPEDSIGDIIIEEQQDFISRMEVPEGTACNTALMENVFVIIVCIFNRLPVFVVGKPGCSKSLAMQIIRSNLRGKDSKDDFFKSLPQLYSVSFQCSESSTSDGILKVFAKAESYQSNSADDVLSVVILDEIGLAEVSRFNPLKVLHNLLEPDGEMRLRVAVVGLSNWSLDSSKMNRAIHLSRTDMDEEELFKTAKAICESFATKKEKNKITKTITVLSAVELSDETVNEDVVFSLKHELGGISKSYHEYSQKLRFKNFHGLRDYYALVKYVAKQLISKHRGSFFTKQTFIEDVPGVVKSGLERNFGGLPYESKTLYEIFNNHFNFAAFVRRNVLDLITENVSDQMARHLMLITSGDSSLGILEQLLNRIGRSTKEIIFGSQFDDDLTDDYNYRILSKIILCMEEGIILILKDLENIYGSLYDMLNQNYTVIGNKKNCRVALGAYSNPICQVSNTFRCIVLMDESKVENCDPPFLNRFEKQHLRFSDVLDAKQTRIVNALQTWINGLREIRERTFDFTDVFPIYGEDFVPSLVLKTQRECERTDTSKDNLFELCKWKLIWIIKPEAVIRLKRAISTETAVEADEIKQAYFSLPLHQGLNCLMTSQLPDDCSLPEQNGALTIVFTNSNMHTSLKGCVSDKFNVQTEKLGTFKSEKQVSTKVKQFWSEDSNANILLVQCSALDDEKHIILTKSIIERFRTAYEKYGATQKKHVYLIIHAAANKGLSKVNSQINFMSDWNLVMIDSLEAPQIDVPTLCSFDILEAIKNKRYLHQCVRNQLFWSFTRIKYSPLGRDIESITDILTKIKSSSEFLQFLDEEIWRIISEMEIHEEDWQTKVACDIQALRNSSSFVEALEQYILTLIKIPLTKLIFCMEKHGVLDCYFIDDSVSVERRQVLLKILHDEQIFSLKEIPDETGPECYSCETPDCALRMPFSRVLFYLLESQKEEFLANLSLIKINTEIDENESLKNDVYNDLLVKQEKQMGLCIADWQKFSYKTCEKDYIHDFSSILSVSICSSMRKRSRASTMEWVVSQKTDLAEKTTLGVLVHLHGTAWMNISLFQSEMQLLAICQNFGLDKHILDQMARFSGLQSERISENSSRHFEDDRDENDVTHDGNFSNVAENEFDRNVIIDPVNDVVNEEKVDQAQVSSEVYQMNAEYYLVHEICQGMFPTVEEVKKFKGIQSWQRAVNAIVTIAAKVSVESNLLHELRVCNEIAGNIVIPIELDTTVFYQLGEILLSEDMELDSEEVFHNIVDIVSLALKTNSSFQENCYRALSSYVARCISVYPDTKVVDLLLVFILNNPIPEKMVGLFRKPLLYAIEIESTGLEDKLRYFSPGVCSFIKDAVEMKANANTDNCETAEKGVFFHALDKFLKELAINKRRDDPFVLLIVDLLADLYEPTLQIEISTGSTERFRRVYDCHTKVTENNFGIEYVSALAYIRTFMIQLGKHQMWDYNASREYWKAVDVLLCESSINQLRLTLLMHFIKCISKGLTLPQLKMCVDSNRVYHNFLKEVCMSQGPLHFSFDVNPFCLSLNEKDHLEIDLCNGIHNIDNVERTLINIVPDKCNNANMLQYILSFVFKEYQLTKCLPESRDKMSFLLTKFTGKMEKDKNRRYNILKFLSGVENFKCTGFDLQKESKNMSFDAQMFLIHFYIFLLSHAEFTKGDQTSVFIRCLTCPVTVKDSFLPGLWDSVTEYDEGRDKNVALAICKCGSRIAVHFENKVTDTTCVFCSNLLIFEKDAVRNTYNVLEKQKTIWKYENSSHCRNSVRGLHPLTCHLLQLMIKGCVIGSLAFGFSSVEHLKELIGEWFEESDFLKNINRHWSHLSDMLNLDGLTMSNLFRMVILKASELFCENQAHPLTASGRYELERKFEKVLENIFKDRFDVVNTTLSRHNKLHGIKDMSIENLLTETNNISELSEEDRQSQLPLLFRMKTTPTEANFVSELMWRKSEFPFLDLILQFDDELSVPKHLFSLIQWHVTTVANISYMLKKHECFEMTVQSLFYFNKKKTDLLKARFNAFQEAWTSLRKYFSKTDLGAEIKHVHTATKLKDCLMYNTDTVMFKVLKELVNVHNQFLNKTLMIASKSEALHFLSVKENVFVFPCVQITEARREDLVEFQFNNDSWKDEYVGRLKYGCGRETAYDFHSLEKRFAMQILSGKSYIDFRHSVPNIIFADELYVNYAELLLEVKKHIKQKSLTDEIKASIQAKKNDDPKMVKDLLSHLGSLMTLLKKTGGDANMSLVDYVSEWHSILSHDFPKDLLPHPESSVKLCHIIALNEMLEEICSESVLDALEKDYTEELEDVAKAHVTELLCDGQMMRILLQALKRFVYRGVFTQTADADRPLYDYLLDSSFWPQSCTKEKNVIKIGDKEESVQTLLPDYLMVRHVQSLVKEMEKEMEKKEKESIHMHDIAIDSKHYRERRPQQTKAKAQKAWARKMKEF